MNDEITPEECVAKLSVFLERVVSNPPEYIYMEEETFNTLKQEVTLTLPWLKPRGVSKEAINRYEP